MTLTLRDRLRAAARGFVTGQVVVDRHEMAWGHDTESFSPAEYGEYIATSNGVYTCSTIRADLLSSLPLRLYRVNRLMKKVEVTQGSLYTLLQFVNPFWTFPRLMEMTELSLCLWGKCYWFLERGQGGAGEPREIWWARPDRVRLHPHPEEYISHYTYRPVNGSQEMTFDRSEVIRFVYPNPLDEFEGLSPLAAARLAADMASASMKSNVKMFENALMMGGVVTPKAGSTLTSEQAKELEMQLDRRFKGVDKAHRWGVFRFEAQMNAVGITPKDAEFLGGLKWSLEEICRAYKVPQDLVGGQRTYENVDAAYRAIWTNAVIPEGNELAADIKEQLLPMFPGQADLAEFDASGVNVLQEAEAERWTRDKEQLEVGAITLNEWRDKQGLEPFEEGDTGRVPLLDTVGGIQGAVSILQAVAMGQMTVESATNLFVLFFGLAEEKAKAMVGNPPKLEGSGGPPPDAEELPAEEDVAEDEDGERSMRVRAVAYGSKEHTQLWKRFVRRAERHEDKIASLVRDLFKRQRDSVLDRLRQKERTAGQAADEPFSIAQWLKAFRIEMRPILVRIVEDIGTEALEDLGVSESFDVSNPAVVRFIERRAQRFAQEVNQTTWDELKASLAEGIDAGESLDELAARVEDVIGGRIRSSAETIARTETIGASNGGMLEAWKQSEVVEGKGWLAALDDRTRDTHQEAHNRYQDTPIPLDDDFEVGGCSGPAPGQMGCAEEDINCRCTMTSAINERKLALKQQRRREAVYA